MRICLVLPVAVLFAFASPAFASGASKENDASRARPHSSISARHHAQRASRQRPAIPSPDPSDNAADGAAYTPAFAFCGTMGMPPTQLREISRGFSRLHSGIDLMAAWGSPIRAAAGGTILYAGWYFAYGNIVDIQHADGVITRYGHMSSFAPGIRPGTPVAAGEVIGAVGATGRATGAHVHFEVRINGRAVDPKPYLGLAGCGNMPRHEQLEEAHAPEPATSAK